MVRFLFFPDRIHRVNSKNLSNYLLQIEFENKRDAVNEEEKIKLHLTLFKLGIRSLRSDVVAPV